MKELVVWFREADLHVFINEGYARLSTSLKRVLGSVAKFHFYRKHVFPSLFSLVHNTHTLTHQKCPVSGSIWAYLLSTGTGCIQTCSTFRLIALLLTLLPLQYLVNCLSLYITRGFRQRCWVTVSGAPDHRLPNCVVDYDFRQVLQSLINK